MKKGVISLSLIAIVMALTAIIVVLPKLRVDDGSMSLGSVRTGDEYSATTTHALSVAVRTLKVGSGSLAQVTITGANTGPFTLYNATTSNVAARHPSKATSTIFIADFPASTAAGTYLFDAKFDDGLLFVGTGLTATGSIMWR